MADNESCSWRTEYDIIEALSTYYGIYIVGKSGKMGVIRLHVNIAIEYAIPIEYDEIRIFFKNDYLLLAQKQDKKRIIKVTKNKTIPGKSQFYFGKSHQKCSLFPVGMNMHEKP